MGVKVCQAWLQTDSLGASAKWRRKRAVLFGLLEILAGLKFYPSAATVGHPSKHSTTLQRQGGNLSRPCAIVAFFQAQGEPDALGLIQHEGVVGQGAHCIVGRTLRILQMDEMATLLGNLCNLRSRSRIHSTLSNHKGFSRLWAP